MTSPTFHESPPENLRRYPPPGCYISRFYSVRKMSNPRDRAILNAILNPFLPVEAEESEGPENDQVELTKEVIEAKKIERRAVQLAEENKVKEAIREFDEAISIAPHLASLYNNRGQAYRLAGDTDKALDDLNKAITLSSGKGKSACQAFCQRGLINRKNGEDDKAMDDFRQAAQLGSSYAKMALVQLNPYAALCNQMLQEVMEKLRDGTQIE